MAKYGVITEQGDLGLGFDPLNEKDNIAVNEAVQRQKAEQNQQIINEDKKN